MPELKKNVFPMPASSTDTAMQAIIVLLWAVAALFTNTARAHMYMYYPPALGGFQNPITEPDKMDYALSSPLEVDGSNFPCRGHNKLLGTPSGRSVATWNAGSTYNVSINGSAFHGGGTCQGSLSYDSGKTFTVIHSWMGGCPASNGVTSFNFKVPPDAPSGQAVFAWTWLNQIGRREFYMNCASVDISGGDRCGEKVAFKDRPAPLVANIPTINDCESLEDYDMLLPDPGPDIDKNSTVLRPPVGNCTVTKSAASPAGAACTSSGSGAPGPTTTPTPKPNAAERQTPGLALAGAVALNAAVGWWFT